MVKVLEWYRLTIQPEKMTSWTARPGNSGIWSIPTSQGQGYQQGLSLSAAILVAVYLHSSLLAAASCRSLATPSLCQFANLGRETRGTENRATSRQHGTGVGTGPGPRGIRPKSFGDQGLVCDLPLHCALLCKWTQDWFIKLSNFFVFSFLSFILSYQHKWLKYNAKMQINWCFRGDLIV